MLSDAGGVDVGTTVTAVVISHLVNVTELISIWSCLSLPQAIMSMHTNMFSILLHQGNEGRRRWEGARGLV